MIRAFYAPCRCLFSSSTPHSLCQFEKAWLFDKSVWQKMFRTMSGCGFDTVVLDSAGLLGPFSETLNVHRTLQEDIGRMQRWIFAAARDYDLVPYLGIVDRVDVGDVEYRTADGEDPAIPIRELRGVLEDCPELGGLVVDCNSRHLQAVVQELDSARPDMSLFVATGSSKPARVTAGIQRRGGKPVHYLVPYTRNVLVDGGCTDLFAEWTDCVGGELAAADVCAANFDPWTSFSYDTAEQVVSNLDTMGCAGFVLHPLAPDVWPHSSDSLFNFQWQRDLVWYSVWGGSSVDDLLRRAYPKWLLRNRRLIDGFQSASRILEVAGLYFARPEPAEWLPQYCGVREGGRVHLLSIQDMADCDALYEDKDKPLWEQVTGDRIVTVAEYLKNGTPPGSYGPEELIEELCDLAADAAAAAEKGMRNASGEKELPGHARDAFCMARLGEFYVERVKAALAHGRGEQSEAVEHVARSVGLYREIVSVDGSHRRWPSADCTERNLPTLSQALRALDSEYQDCRAGRFAFGLDYPLQAGGES